MPDSAIRNPQSAIVSQPSRLTEDIISSYEERIAGDQSIFDTTHELIEGFQDSFLDTKQEREKLKAEVRENLAKSESLRKKDFDNMMQGILSAQEQKEKEVRDLLKNYLNEQRAMAHTLRDNLAEIKGALTKGEAIRVKEFQGIIKEILARQDERKDEVASGLKDFQKAQQEMAKRLKELLAKGSELRIKDLKSMLKEFQSQHKERIVRQEERRGEVKNLLGGFMKERAAANENWRVVQRKMAQRRGGSRLAIHLVGNNAEAAKANRFFNGINIDIQKQVKEKAQAL